MCIQRGLQSKEAIEEFLNPTIEDLHDPFLMHDMEKAVKRIDHAIMENEKITIYGDYDADGVTSVTTLLETFHILGANVNFVIPHRSRDGYGPNITLFQEIVASGTQLIITVDNGVAGVEAIEWAMSQGVDVIVTDHHELPEHLPAAYAVVHPRHPDGRYPFGDLAGVGVAFKLATALLGEIPYELLDLVAIGTVADLVSLTDENRILVQFGLQMINHTERIGLQELCNVCGLRLGEIDEQSIGFQIAPRINAAGRLDEADIAVNLLQSWDVLVAKDIAQQLDTINQQRKQIVEDMTKEAIKFSDDRKYVIAKEGWHEGVLGIVASRLVEKTKKPMIVLTIDQKNELVKGSARSVLGFNMFEILNSLSQYLDHYGGHEMAAGLSLKCENLQAFQAAFNEKVNTASLSKAPLVIDQAMTIADISIQALEEINQLKPFGTDNKAPIFILQHSIIQSVRTIGTDNNHLKLLATDGQQVLDVIGFNFGHELPALYNGEAVDIVGHVEIKEWQGKRSPQMILEDLAVEDLWIYDERKNQLQLNDFKDKECLYVVYNQELAQNITEQFPEIEVADITTLEQAKTFIKNCPLIFVDCPPSVELFVETIKGNESQALTLYFYKKDQTYIQGLPTREEMSMLYKFIVQHQNIPVQDGGQVLAQFIQIPLKRTQDILKMFLDAKFVTINGGVLNSVKHPSKIDLKTTATYQKLMSELQAEKELIYSSFSELKRFISKWIEE
ncbi:single-stranded-DNA-specific exonuclease RecJ [Allofustis seminis]|uniref:single-stranded-DNA-specific exonuclease RecJ n=1 Tax=Allofustis seminis TaxID=166939 RepID=UPI00037C8A78|nr:single-stranded-DNA-specific exonuclease RecJ [Allofustis seminis]